METTKKHTIEVERELIAECFALLGVATFSNEALDEKRKVSRDRIVELFNK